MDADFPPEPPSPSDESEDIQFDVEQRVITWWVVVFTCTLQTLHSLPSRAAQWLLQFLYCLLTILGRYSPKIGDIARGFPKTLYLRTQFLKDHMYMLVPKPHHMVVCQACHSLYSFEDCIEKRGSRIFVRLCCECQSSGKSIHC